MSQPSIRTRRSTYRPQLEPLEDRLTPAAFIVNSLGDEPDSNPGDGVALASSGGSGSGSVTTLRAAIEEANAFDDGGEPDTITFDIPGAVGTVQTIMPATSLPAITANGLTIDGYTQGNATPNTNGPGQGSNAVLRVAIDATNIPTGANGLEIFANGCTIRGLVINNFRTSESGANGHGILVSAGRGNTIEGCFIGTDATGTTAQGNEGNGIMLVGSTGNLIGGLSPAARNLISANGNNGVELLGNFSESGSTVQGNLIGTDISGTLNRGNSANGVLVSGMNHLIGGDTSAARNLISGNGTNGVLITSGAEGSSFSNQVFGNYIGTNVTGGEGLGNGASGVRIEGADNNEIGDVLFERRNVISANGNDGVMITAFFAEDGTETETGSGSRIAAGAHGLGGGLYSAQGGLSVHSFAGARAGDIGTQQEGHLDPAEGNQIVNNFIGVAADGSSPLGNVDAGVHIAFGSLNTVGGTEFGAGNVIAFNGSGDCMTGVAIESTATFNPILGNAIFNNNGLGIDLDEDGVTPNDTGDTDIGGNDLQNFPELTEAISTQGQLTLRGTFNSTASRTFRLEFFLNTVVNPDSAGNPETAAPFGEGRRFLVSREVTTDATGNVAGGFDFTSFVPTGTTVEVGNFITVTATRLMTDSATVFESTSEFSGARIVTAGTPPEPGGRVRVFPRVFHPFRFNLGTNTGFITLLSKISYSGPTTIVLKNLPPGVVVLNATGVTANGDPFITKNKALSRNVPMRFNVRYTNTVRVYDTTFYNGFPVSVFVGPFDSGRRDR